MALFHEGDKSTFAGGTVGQAMAKHRLMHGKEESKDKKHDKHAEVSDHIKSAKEALDKAQMAHDGAGETPQEEQAEHEGGGLLSALGQMGSENSEA